MVACIGSRITAAKGSFSLSLLNSTFTCSKIYCSLFFGVGYGRIDHSSYGSKHFTRLNTNDEEFPCKLPSNIKKLANCLSVIACLRATSSAYPSPFLSDKYYRFLKGASL